MPITYAGRSIVLEDPQHKFQSWLDRTLSLDDLSLFAGEPIALREERYMMPKTCNDNAGFGRHNWPETKRLKLNTLLWYSTGASRFSRGLFLAASGETEHILSTVRAGGGKAQLVISESSLLGSSTTLTVDMYLLPPRRITSVSPTGGTEVAWLMPLVDVRYLWQWCDMAATLKDIDKTVTWEDLISHFNNQLGTALDPGDTAGYLKPDFREWKRHHENAAVLLDVAAKSLGRRLVAKFDGTFILETFTDAQTTLQQNLANAVEGDKLAGGEMGASIQLNTIPQTIKVVFPKWLDGAFQPDEMYSIDKTATDFTESEVAVVAGKTATIYTMAQANFTGSGESPDNSSELDLLADKLAGDYAKSRSRWYDISWQGVQPWTPCAFDDYIWLHYGYQYPSDTEGDYAAFTRVACLPYDFGSQRHSHQIDDPQIDCSTGGGSLARFTLSEQLLVTMETVEINVTEVFIGDISTGSSQVGYNLKSGLTADYVFSGAQSTAGYVMKRDD